MADHEGLFEPTANRLALDRARYFFRICDCEKKGFVVKSDMRRLKNDFPELTEDQLGEVFDSLDRDGNRRLTLEEFVHGFGKLPILIGGHVFRQETSCSRVPRAPNARCEPSCRAGKSPRRAMYA